MKKILLTAVAALAIVGCSQNEEIEKAGEKAEINFGTIVSKTTRAAVTTLDSLQKSGFTVYAYNTGQETIGEKESKGVLSDELMSKVTVEYSGSEWGITGNGKYYWPLNDKIQFFAYATDNSVSNYVAEETGAYPKVDYKVADAIDKQIDFVVAQALNKTQTDSKVTLPFIHVLTQVNFSAKTENADLKYNITSVKLTGVSNAGTYNFADTTWVAKTAAENIKSYTYFEDANGVSIVKNNIVKLQQNEALMLIPQSLTNVSIVISYNILQNNKIIKQVTGETISLASTTDWKAGKKIRYTLALTETGTAVSFDASVADWDEPETDPLNPTPVE